VAMSSMKENLIPLWKERGISGQTLGGQKGTLITTSVPTEFRRGFEL